MSNSYIRIYDKPSDEGRPATWLGLGATPSREIAQKETDFFGFFTERSYSVTKVDAEQPDTMRRIRNIGGVSCSYYEITPPFSEELHAELGKVCEQLIDPGNNFAVLMDNRNDPFPTTPPSSPRKVVHKW